MKSLNFLLQSPYNKKNRLFAFYRFFYWKLIRLFKLEDVKFSLWKNKQIYLNYDSFQSMWVMYNYYVDWEEFNLISKYVKPGDQLFDIGANMGFYTIWMSKFIGEGKIHAFEPDDKNYERLNKNIALNGIEGLVTANKKAVSDVDGEVAFTTGFDGENHIVNALLPNAIQISSLQVDQYVKEHNIEMIAYMKIDVEGFEYSVLKGASNSLSNKRIDILQIEINSTITNSGQQITNLLELLELYEYELCKFDVIENQLVSTAFSVLRENYFATCDLENVNQKLMNTAKLMQFRCTR